MSRYYIIIPQRSRVSVLLFSYILLHSFPTDISITTNTRLIAIMWLGVGRFVEKGTVGLIVLDAISGVMLVKALSTAA